MKSQKNKYFLSAIVALIVCSCGDDKFNEIIPLPDPSENTGGNENQNDPISRNEQYRPQIHFTPGANWMNDPNGMVYADGIWHLYYQYNPSGNDWGNMSWGHAISNDLIHWEEQSVAMTPNKYGDIFSGSAIYDKDNVAGFGQGAILAFYTANGSHQQQCLAYSTDGGNTYNQYEGNPIIPNNDMPDFRDPKVFYHAETGKYIMVLAKGWDCSIDIWGSSNLKSWSKLSEFRIDKARCNVGQWECPDLIKLPYKGGEKWVLIVSTNPGGPASGSGTFYFVGEFDGEKFIADDLDYPLWLDSGSDNYAGVTWSNSPSGRIVYLGWMNNWNYAGAVPCSPWRSAMTLPREIVLADMNGSPVISTTVVEELTNISGEWRDASNGICEGGKAYEIKVSLDLSKNHSFKLGNDAGEYVSIDINTGAGKVIMGRSASSGVVSFNGLFSLPGISAPYDRDLDILELHLYVDQSSVELISADGKTAITCLVFPTSVYNKITGEDNVTYRVLDSIW